MSDQVVESQNPNQVRRIVPQSGLDWNMMLTDTMWGSAQVKAQIQDKIKQRHANKGQFDEGEAWELLSLYTRDLRLANLNPLTGELQYCQYYIDLAGDFLREGMPEAFATALARAATLLELSQSKGGFLRRRQNTLTSENLSGEITEKKNRLLSLGRNRGT